MAGGRGRGKGGSSSAGGRARAAQAPHTRRAVRRSSAGNPGSCSTTGRLCSSATEAQPGAGDAGVRACAAEHGGGRSGAWPACARHPHMRTCSPRAPVHHAALLGAAARLLRLVGPRLVRHGAVTRDPLKHVGKVAACEGGDARPPTWYVIRCAHACGVLPAGGKGANLARPLLSCMLGGWAASHEPTIGEAAHTAWLAGKAKRAAEHHPKPGRDGAQPPSGARLHSQVAPAAQDCSQTRHPPSQP